MASKGIGFIATICVEHLVVALHADDKVNQLQIMINLSLKYDRQENRIRHHKPWFQKFCESTTTKVRLNEYLVNLMLLCYLYFPPNAWNLLRVTYTAKGLL